MTVLVSEDAVSVRHFVRDCQQTGKTVGVVMTMGALHEGHLSLVSASNEQCDITVVTIFVNPTQFGAGEDLDSYPRQLDADLELLGKLSVDYVFAPTVDQMYRDEHSTSICPPSVAEPWEGRCRPGHFGGVATIVLKLLQIIPANVAYFGKKDFQQLQVIRATVADLNVDTVVVGCPIVRDADGLAMSSRNAYLSSTERSNALSLSQGLSAAATMFQQGETNSGTLAACIRQQLAAAGITKVDYVAVVDPDTLHEATKADANSVALIAAFVGETRLIDNRRLGDGPILAS